MRAFLAVLPDSVNANNDTYGKDSHENYKQAHGGANVGRGAFLAHAIGTLHESVYAQGADDARVVRRALAVLPLPKAAKT
jgi:hypothetical protein